MRYLRDNETGEPESILYFAYGSNMNLDQMMYRCPESEALRPVTLDGYVLAFRGNGYATILPEKGSQVEGVLWEVSQRDVLHLDRFEGFPKHYTKRTVDVSDRYGNTVHAMVYVMAAPLRDQPALPSQSYYYGILEGCRQNGIGRKSIEKALSRTVKELRQINKGDPRRSRKKDAHENSR